MTGSIWREGARSPLWGYWNTPRAPPPKAPDDGVGAASAGARGSGAADCPSSAGESEQASANAANVAINRTYRIVAGFVAHPEVRASDVCIRRADIGLKQTIIAPPPIFFDSHSLALSRQSLRYGIRAISFSSIGDGVPSRAAA